MKPLDQCFLYAFIDSAYLHGRDPSELARQLCAGGADLIQLRAKGQPLDEIRRMASQIAPIIERAGVNLVINDFPEIAAETGAPFCHLGQEDFFDAGHTHVRLTSESARGLAQSKTLRDGEAATNLRQVLDSASPLALSQSASQMPQESVPLRFGLSSHAPNQAQRAISAGAAYVAVGPVYSTATKPGAPAVSLDYVRWAAENVKIPWFAIGGIDLKRLDAVLEAGARRVCVVSAILTANVTEACQAFKNRLLSASRT